jgi:hypothetical protein
VKYLLLCSSKIQNFDEIDPAVCIYTKKAEIVRILYNYHGSIFPSSMRRESETTLLNGTFYAMVLVVL